MYIVYIDEILLCFNYIGKVFYCLLDCFPKLNPTKCIYGIFKNFICKQILFMSLKILRLLQTNNNSTTCSLFTIKNKS